MTKVVATLVACFGLIMSVAAQVNEGALSVLRRTLLSGQPIEKIAAFHSCVGIVSTKTLELAVTGMKDKDRSVRVAAAECFATVIAAEIEVFRTAIDKLKVEAKTGSTPSLDAVKKQLDELTPYWEMKIAKCGEYLPRLIAEADFPDPAVRRALILFLLNKAGGTNDEPDDDIPTVAWTCGNGSDDPEGEALGYAVEKNPDITCVLVRDPSTKGRVALFDNLSADAPGVFEIALSFASHPCSNFRESALYKLSAIEKPGVVDALYRLSEDKWARIRYAALEELFRRKDRKILARMKRALWDPDPDVREMAMKFYANLAGPASAKVFVEILRSGDESDRVSALGRLGDFAVPSTFSSVAKAFLDKSPKVRAAAIEALSKIDEKRGTAYVITGLDDPDYDVKWEAIYQAGSLRIEKAVSKLRGIAQSTDSILAERATDAIKEILGGGS